MKRYVVHQMLREERGHACWIAENPLFPHSVFNWSSISWAYYHSADFVQLLQSSSILIELTFCERLLGHPKREPWETPTPSNDCFRLWPFRYMYMLQN